MAKNWISASDLHTQRAHGNTVVFDVQFDLSRPEMGRVFYTEGHIPGAHFLDLYGDLSGAPGLHGGRHPLPDWDAFIPKLEAAGVTPDTDIIIYDDIGGVSAARLWWMVKYLGIDRVKLLDGGLSGWVDMGFEMSKEVPAPKTGQVVPEFRPEWAVSIDEVREISRLGAPLIDSRHIDRFNGRHEPIDAVAGHIPGAQHFFFQENLQGHAFKPLDVLRKRFADVDPGAVVYCGSGITAAHNAVVLDELDLKPRLYVGSWSDWISYPDNPIETEVLS